MATLCLTARMVAIMTLLAFTQLRGDTIDDWLAKKQAQAATQQADSTGPAASQPTSRPASEVDAAIHSDMGKVTELRYRDGNAFYFSFVEKMYKEHLSIWQQAANGGSADGLLLLGICNQEGHGLEQNIDRAVDCFRKAAAGGNTAAMQCLADLYHDGRGVPKDGDERLKWLEKAVQAGDASAMQAMGDVYHDSAVRRIAELCAADEDYKKAFEWYKKAAEASWAAHEAASNVSVRLGTPPIAPVSVNVEAMGSLAVMYLDGNGVAKNIEEFEKWRNRSAASGNSVSEPDQPSQTIEALEKDAEAGNTSAMVKLGHAYEKLADPKIAALWTTDKDCQKAIEWYKRAADGGSYRGMCSLGTAYRLGEGVTEDDVEELKWYRRAADGGEALSMEYLAEGCEDKANREQDHGETAKSQRDFSEAAMWYRKAAMMGYFDAMERLAEICRTGRGVPKNLVEAERWIEASEHSESLPEDRLITAPIKDSERPKRAQVTAGRDVEPIATVAGVLEPVPVPVWPTTASLKYGHWNENRAKLATDYLNEHPLVFEGEALVGDSSDGKLFVALWRNPQTLNGVSYNEGTVSFTARTPDEISHLVKKFGDEHGVTKIVRITGKVRDVKITFPDFETDSKKGVYLYIELENPDITLVGK